MTTKFPSSIKSMYKYFSIFKVKEKKNEKYPDYSISMKVGDKYETIGGCWLKESSSGKYFSCQLSNSFKNEKTDRNGYSIVGDPEVKQEPVVPPQGYVYPKEDINPQDIPF